MTTFTDLGLAASVLKGVADEGYTTPTPIQAQGIPAILSGSDVLGLAQTGTGKTASFVLPLLHRIAENRAGRPAPKTCGALILAPTRELAAQIADSIRVYGRHMRHSATVVVGGARPMPQIRNLARGQDIVVATPGRLLDHMSTGAVTLSTTTTIVLDEADHMLDLGFLPAIRKILAALPRQRQTILLSATMPKPIRALAEDFLHEPQEIAVAPASKPIDRIEQKVLLMEKDAKRQALIDVLRDADLDRAIVFTRTKHGADKVARQLEQAGLGAGAIHGNKSQGQRQRTLDAFRAGRTPILVATDIAARGIDVDGVSHVVNFELPNVPESYVHRIGRTARAGKSGIAVSFCDMSERPYLRDIEKLIGKTLVERDDDPRPARGGKRPARGGGGGQTAGNRPKRNRPQRGFASDERDGAPRAASGERPARAGKGPGSGRPPRDRAAAPKRGDGRSDGGHQGRKRSRPAGGGAVSYGADF
ncbi:DEAD/DEAH box helicase [Stappia sp.]|uniref:DEAD/DEAH box helicase n=1 Tax=Stappia sp. TaxID=1870903 RepID=UPI0032D8ED0D